MSEIKKGDTWHLKIGNATCVSTMTVVEVTKETVVLVDATGMFFSEDRYSISDINFIEKVCSA